MITRLRLLGIAVCLAGIAALSGCGSGYGVTPASGVVMMDGQPVPEAKVMFHPIDGGPRTSYGTTNEKGEFKVSTYGMYDGALIGRHVVTITKVDTSSQVKVDPNEGYMGQGYEQMMAPDNLAKASNPKFILPEKYSSKETSGIEVDVVAGETNNFPFNLE